MSLIGQFNIKFFDWLI